MSDAFDHTAPSSALLPSDQVVAPSAEVVSPALAALTRPPKVGDVIEHDGRSVRITGTRFRGPGDFSVIIDSGETLRSR